MISSTTVNMVTSGPKKNENKTLIYAVGLNCGNLVTGNDLFLHKIPQAKKISFISSFKDFKIFINHGLSSEAFLKSGAVRQINFCRSLYEKYRLESYQAMKKITITLKL